MGLADPAGTLQFGMSRTLDIDDEYDEGVPAYGLCFLVGYNEYGVYLDSCFDVTAMLGKTWEGVLAAEKLTGIKNEELHMLSLAITHMELRARFIHTGLPGPYLVKTSSPLSRDELETYLRSLDKRSLKLFLEKAKV